MINSTDPRPIVAHVMRGYLARTETFIGNQIATLRAFRPIVLCHHRIDGHSYHMDGIVPASEILSGFWQRLDRLAYLMGRMATPPAIDALAERILTSSARLIHFHYLVDARFFLALKRRTGLPAVVSAYGYDVSSFPRAYGGCGRRYLRPLFDQMDWFIAMSQDMQRDLVGLGCPPEKTLVHYHGIDTRRFAYPERAYSDREQVGILAVASLIPKKAQGLMLRALRQVELRSMALCRFRVLLVGDGQMRSSLEQQVREYGWEGRVTFAGHLPHNGPALVGAYRGADIFCLPSVTSCDGDKEGIPGTIVEAMASGLPVVSTYHAGIPEIVESGRDGLLVREGDIDGLARALADLIENRDLREQLGRAAARRATGELDLQSRTANLERLYSTLLHL